MESKGWAFILRSKVVQGPLKTVFHAPTCPAIHAHSGMGTKQTELSKGGTMGTPSRTMVAWLIEGSIPSRNEHLINLIVNAEPTRLDRGRLWNAFEPHLSRPSLNRPASVLRLARPSLGPTKGAPQKQLGGVGADEFAGFEELQGMKAHARKGDTA